MKKVILILVCLIVAACDSSTGKQAIPKAAERGNSPVEATLNNGPECAKVNKDGTLKVPGGCTREDWKKWRQEH